MARPDVLPASCPPRGLSRVEAAAPQARRRRPAAVARAGRHHSRDAHRAPRLPGDGIRAPVHPPRLWPLVSQALRRGRAAPVLGARAAKGCGNAARGKRGDCARDHGRDWAPEPEECGGLYAGCIAAGNGRQRYREAEEGVMSLEEAIERLKTELPGWWWSVSECSVSADASIAPDIAGPDAALLTIRLFDEGFHADLRQPSTPATALLNVLEQAKAAIAKLRRE